MFSALAFILMTTISIPIIPYAPYLRYEPSEVASIFIAVLFGPWAGVVVCFLKDLLYFFFRAKSIFGPTADFFASGVFTFIIGAVYCKHRNKKSLIIAGILATIGRILIMIPINIVILWLQFGFTTSKALNMMLPIIIPFNSLKSIINFIAFYLIFSILIKRTRFVTEN